MHGVIDRAHARSSYTNSGYSPCALVHGRSATQWLITVRLTSRPNVSDDDESTGWRCRSWLGLGLDLETTGLGLGLGTPVLTTRLLILLCLLLNMSNY